MPNATDAERAVRRGVAVAAGDRHPRLREPELRADHVHDALPVVVEPGEAHAEVAAVALERRHHVLGHHVEERPRAARASGRCDRPCANVRSGRATFQPRARSASNACGVVTSWTRCRPMKSCVCPVGSWRTVWRSHTFSKQCLSHVMPSVLNSRWYHLRGPETAGCPATKHRHGRSTPTRMPMRGPHATRARPQPAILDRQAARRPGRSRFWRSEMPSALVRLPGPRHSASASYRGLPSRAPAHHQTDAVERRRARESGPRPDGPRASVTAFTR